MTEFYLDWSKFKVFADDKLILAKIILSFIEKREREC